MVYLRSSTFTSDCEYCEQQHGKLIETNIGAHFKNQYCALIFAFEYLCYINLTDVRLSTITLIWGIQIYQFAILQYFSSEVKFHINVSKFDLILKLKIAHKIDGSTVW